jgi:kynurenine formamidase/predicted dehydrogenase
LIGCGYFSDFHLDAWQRIPQAEIIAVCDVIEHKANQAATKYHIPQVFTDPHIALQADAYDFVDLATGPDQRIELVKRVCERKLPLICQKPLATSFSEAKALIDVADSSGPFMVHENFRFQPWYREIKRLLDAGRLGRKLHSISMRTRLGDGWGKEAYLSRQPYFRTMPRLLIQETGVHFVDTFRYLAGEIIECQATLRRLNELIAGEDAGLLRFRFASGATAIWDANRYNEPLSNDPRYTFGELLVEGDGGSLWLDHEGTITVKPIGEPAVKHEYLHSHIGFGGDCVRATQQHFLDVLNGACCETSGREYLKSLTVVEALYESAARNRPISLGTEVSKGSSNSSLRSDRRIVDLSLPISSNMPGVQVTPCKSRLIDGWNATTLSLYSHSGTHIDAPCHFLDDGSSIDQQDLAVCCGRARVVDLTPVEPKMLITIPQLTAAIGEVFPGDRLLLRTDWHHRYGTPEYRNELPRISKELAHWLVERKVALIGIEQLSVADVNSLPEVTEIHQILFRGGVVIVEALAHLDQLSQPEVEFIALPLKILQGDGCPVRAIAIEGPSFPVYQPLSNAKVT